MKNKRELEEMLKSIEGVMDNLQEFQYDYFVNEYYLKKDIETFAKEFESIEANVNIINGKEADEREAKIIDLWGQFQILYRLFQTKKFMKSKKDIVVVGKLLYNMAEKCIEIGKAGSEK